MTGGIYLVRGGDQLLEMRESPYEAEGVLQALIAKFPSLLAGDQLRGDTPRRWLLVGRESALPDDEDAAGRWSVDHLFLGVVKLVREGSRLKLRAAGMPIDLTARYSESQVVQVCNWAREAAFEVIDLRLDGEEAKHSFVYRFRAKLAGGA